MNLIQRTLARLRRSWNGPEQPVRTVLLGANKLSDAEVSDALRLEGPALRAVDALLDAAILDASSDALSVDAQTTPITLAHVQGGVAKLCEFKALLAQRIELARKGGVS